MTYGNQQITLAGRYSLDQRLGEGGFAEVFSAWDLALNRWVAVKLYDSASSGRISADEARLQAACQHPNLMPLYDAGSDPMLGVSFIVMPLYPGSDLAATINRLGPMAIKTSQLCVDQICSALEFLYQRRQTTHGDIKPANIWLTNSGAALLMDFNLPGVMARGEVTAWTPGYTAPESLNGFRDMRSDVFSLGCVLYECLTGTPPFVDDQSVRSGKYVPLRKLRPEIWPEMESVVNTALNADPNNRFQSAREFQSAIRRPSFVHGESWSSAIWEGLSVAGGLLCKAVGWSYGATWRLIRKAARHFVWRARKRFAQACFEAVFALILVLAGWQWLAVWLHQYQAEAEICGAASYLLTVIAVTIRSRFRAANRNKRRNHN